MKGRLDRVRKGPLPAEWARLGAIVMGTVEVLALFCTELGFSGSFWKLMGSFNINTAGFVIVGFLFVTWIVALGVWRIGKVGARWEAEAAQSRARFLAAEPAD